MAKTTVDRDFTFVRGDAIRHTTLVRDWVCRCGGSLKLGWKDGWCVVCRANHLHPANGFIHKSTYDNEQNLMGIYQDYYDRRVKMGFVKDRHDEKGKILGEHRVRRAGKIVLGEKLEGGGAVAWPHFGFRSFDEGLVGEAMIAQVAEVLERYGEDPKEPKILPVFLPADALELMASSSYKLPGKEGRTRCAGDGETIQFKIGPRNLMEIRNGQVAIKQLKIDNKVYSRGDSVRCPGKDYEDRWGYCERCRFSFQVDLQLAGLPYIWGLTTGDQDFYDQFFTVLELMADHVARGNAKFMSEIPLLLRKEKRTKARPQQSGAGTELRYQDFHLMSIEIHPIWLDNLMRQRTQALPEGFSVPALPEPKVEPEQRTWYEKTWDKSPPRPWDAYQVGTFITDAMEEYRKTNPDADEFAGEGNITGTRGILQKIYAKQMEVEDALKAVDLVMWFFFDGDLQTLAQCAAVYRWARIDKEDGVVAHPAFEEESLVTLTEAATSAEKAGEQTGE